ncbi:hypothetical protein H9I32_16615 [Bacillus sp. Xin]|uniref:BacD n=1 Tax=Bacillus sp. Xin1 TaxID=2740676 RepID=A0A7D5DPW6_9BACI|nr:MULTISPECIES: hypothetical protein [unclassified Bacillus (in: firmicutes)]MBC6973922.1 hypothetical protein [Bacillus sp. Xin]NSW39299.1 hypothetical protein [Bacillus sp. Xin1]QLA09670.1 BacD [Bacillus sp. Xin1]
MHLQLINNQKVIRFSFFILWLFSTFLLFINMNNKETLILEQIKGLGVSPEQLNLFKIVSVVINVFFTSVLLIIVYIILRWTFKKIYNDEQTRKTMFSSIFFLNLNLKFLLFIILNTLSNVFGLDNSKLTIINSILFILISVILNAKIAKIIKIDKFYILPIVFLIVLVI